MGVLIDLLKKTVALGGSDIHLKAGVAPRVRRDGKIIPLDGLGPLEVAALKKEIYPYLSERKRDIFEKFATTEFSIDLPEAAARFRGSLYLERGLPAVTLRAIPNKIPDLKSLNLPEMILKLASNKRGFVLVTGPTGSGKSTALAVMVDYINSNFPYHIITLEDPIEFIHQSKQSLISQRELGEDFGSFPDALRSSLRQDPDVIMVGEMRDLETVRLAIQAAETGHLVLSTLHTMDAPQTIARIVDLFPPQEQDQLRIRLAQLIQGIVSIRLLAQKDGGTIPICEIATGTAYIKKLIVENKMQEIPKAIEAGGHYGMQSFLQSLLEVYNKGLADLEECKQAATNADDFMTRVQGISSGV